jgi:exopolysaccharide production protein ExoZ
MVHTTRNSNSNSGKQSLEFFKRRIIRIVPMYYLCTLIFIAHNLGPSFLHLNGKHLLYSLLFISPMTLPEGPSYGRPLLEIGWTLNYEIIFYLFFTFSLFFYKYKYQILFSIFILISIILPLILTGGFGISYTVYHDYGWNYFNLISNPIILNFAVGVIIGLVAHKITLPAILLKIMLLLSILLFLFYVFTFPMKSINLVTDLFFCGFLVIAFILNDLSPGGIKSLSFPVFLGNISYSLYLIHPITIAYSQVISNKYYPLALKEYNIFFFVVIIVTIILAWVMYELLEKGMTRFLRGKMPAYKLVVQ